MCFGLVRNQPVFHSVAILLVLASEENMGATLWGFSHRKLDPNAYKVKKNAIYYHKTQHANSLPGTEHQNNIAKQLNQKQESILHLIFQHFTVV